MKKILFFVVLIVVLSISLVACGRERQTNQPKSITSSNTQTKTISAEELAPPVEGKRLPKTEEKGLVTVDEQTIVKGYPQVPILLDSYGQWIDEEGRSMENTDVEKVFSDLPEYALATVRYNNNLSIFNTEQRSTIVSELQYKYVYGAEPLTEAYLFNKRFDNLVEAWKADQSILEMVTPEAEGAYELYNEVLELRPESVPIGRDALGRWFDQTGTLMRKRKAKAWLKEHPDCATLIQQINQEAKEYGVWRQNYSDLQRKFRGKYVLLLRSSLDSGNQIIQFENYDWWAEELKNIHRIIVDLTTPTPSTYDETPPPISRYYRQY